MRRSIALLGAALVAVGLSSSVGLASASNGVTDAARNHCSAPSSAPRSHLQLRIARGKDPVVHMAMGDLVVVKAHMAGRRVSVPQSTKQTFCRVSSHRLSAARVKGIFLAVSAGHTRFISFGLSSSTGAQALLAARAEVAG